MTKIAVDPLLSLDDFSQHFREIEKDKLLNHANYAFEMNYIHHNMGDSMVKRDRKYHDVRGDIDDITPQRSGLY